MNPFLLPNDMSSHIKDAQKSTLKPPDVRAPSPLSTAEDAVDTGNWNDPPTRISRSPRPYRRKAREYAYASPLPSRTNSSFPTPVLTPTHSDSELLNDVSTPSSSRLPTRPASRLEIATPGESGAEADDEAFSFAKALPPPPLRPRKGLWNEQVSDIPDGRLARSRRGPKTQCLERTQKENGLLKTQDSVNKTRSIRGRLIQRGCEGACLGLVVYLVSSAALRNANEIEEGTIRVACSYIVLVTILTAFLLARRFRSLMQEGFADKEALSKVDPAPVLYPPLLPVLVSMSLGALDVDTIFTNMILGLSTLSRRLVFSSLLDSRFSTFHWLLTLLPIILGKIMQSINMTASFTAIAPQDVTSGTPQFHDFSLLFPLHQALLSPLRYITMNSLLSSEVQLLSVALINLLTLAQSPQMQIISYILWIGGFGIFYSCKTVLKSNVALERIPMWRFRRAGTVIKATRTFMGALAEGLRGSSGASEHVPGGDKNNKNRSPNGHISETTNVAPRPPLRPTKTKPAFLSPAHGTRGNISANKSKSHKRKPSFTVQPYLSLTPAQVTTTKWLYAGYTYFMIVFLIFGPLRVVVRRYALESVDPIGWALSYLFGDLNIVKWLRQDYPLRSWIPPTRVVHQSFKESTWLAYLHNDTPELRRALFSYWFIVVSLGVGTVLFLSNRIAVDTRRKVFHFTMVGLLLPAAFIDPCFLSLGLIVVVAVFLILEVLRAAQVRPVAQPLARFLSPYVDGRDLRGPIVISHIFLLIGCAIPFWLSLVAIPFVPTESPWNGWVVASRDVSMLAGVICVGMGDAAASLIGRAIGRHKWPWPGGKSLEGSVAFAMAVTVGLAAGKWWLVHGGWSNEKIVWPHFALYACFAASIAAMTEAVLTGCNDNVVVPLMLWLAVRGVDL